MKLLVKENPRTLALVSKETVLVFRHFETKNKESRCAIEFLPKGDIELKHYKKLTDREIGGFLGFIEVNGDTFICCINGSTRVAMPVPHESINKIHSVDFYSVNNGTWDYVELDSNGFPIMPEQDSTPGEYGSGSNGQYVKHPCQDLRKLLSSGGFYYSSDFDLTSSLQARGVGSHSLSMDKYKEEYMWNSFMLQEMVEFRNRLDQQLKEKLDDEGFLTTVIRGFAKTVQTSVEHDKCAMTIISRQSWKRAGTRFNSRGVDDEGYVANFVETEVILFSKKICYSYTQIRGSIPVFWEQDTALINPKVQITRSEEATHPVFVTHFKRLLEEYNAINIVNLLSTKSSELPLSQRYRSHVKRMIDDGTSDLYMTDFDFHRETSDKGFSSATKIYNLIKESLYEFGYFSYEVSSGKVLSEQSGVFRTNCLDCLDRTNLIQQFISNFAMTIFLKDHKRYVPQESQFFTHHNSLWADNGDQISQIYTGTNALKSSFSRKGKMSFAGALSDATKSVSRMYINNFQDKGKQVTIDTLLGRLNGQSPVLLYDPVTDYVNEKVGDLKDQYTSYQEIGIFAGTFNVNGADRVDDLSEWLYPIGDKFKPNVVILGFQEVIELTAGSIINADYSKSSFWTKEVNKCLNQHDKYIMLRAEQMSSLMLLFFVRADSMEHIKRVEGANKKTGLGGITGNKGAVGIRFNYGSSSFCFVNVHLAAGTTNVQDRNNDYQSILNSVKFTRNQTIHDNETVFWIGDLNYRIALTSDEVRRRIEKGDFEYLMKYDQLTEEIRSNRAFAGYSEPSLNFNPTYKYDKGTSRYDSSEKFRTPSWTDRIIYKSETVKPLAYSSSDGVVFSDHKPVYSAYKAKVEFIDEEEKLKLSKDIYDKYKAIHVESSTISLVDLGNSQVDTKVHHTQPNFLDADDEEYKPKLPDRNAALSPHISSEVLTPRRNSPKPTPPPSRSGALPNTNSTAAALPSRPPTSGSITASNTTLSPPPPPPAPRSATPVDVKAVPISTKASPPPAPLPRKALPPGFSESVLVPKSATPSRSGTPLPTLPTEKKTAPPSVPKKPLSLASQDTESKAQGSKSPPPLVPKKPQTLSQAPIIPKKPQALKSPSGAKESDDASVNTPSRTSTPVEHQNRGMNNWQPLVPK